MLGLGRNCFMSRDEPGQGRRSADSACGCKSRSFSSNGAWSLHCEHATMSTHELLQATLRIVAVQRRTHSNLNDDGICANRLKLDKITISHAS